ncbi:carbohydrate porin, partial [Acetobacter sp. DsW_059]
REMTWDQELFNKHLYILAGRANPKGGEFEGSELYCMFATFLCSSPTTLTIDGSSPSFTSATWAARILVKPTASTYI